MAGIPPVKIHLVTGGLSVAPVSTPFTLLRSLMEKVQKLESRIGVSQIELGAHLIVLKVENSCVCNKAYEAKRYLLGFFDSISLLDSIALGNVSKTEGLAAEYQASQVGL